MLTEQIFAQATLLAGNLGEKQRELLRILCAAATSGLISRLKESLTPDDCGTAFVMAASLIALAGMQETGHEAELEEFRAGDLTVKKGRADTDPDCLRYQAEQLMRPYLKDGFVFQGV